MKIETNRPAPTLDLAAVTARYSAALDVRPSKGVEIGSDGYTVLTDAVADIPALLAEIDRMERYRAIYEGVLDRLAGVIAEAADRLGIPEDDEESSTSLLEKVVARAEVRT